MIDVLEPVVSQARNPSLHSGNIQESIECAPPNAPDSHTLAQFGFTCLMLSDHSQDDDPMVAPQCFLLRFGVGVSTPQVLGKGSDFQNNDLMAGRGTHCARRS